MAAAKSSYSIQVSDMTNGQVLGQQATVWARRRLTLTVTLAEGELGTLTVTDRNGETCHALTSRLTTPPSGDVEI